MQELDRHRARLIAAGVYLLVVYSLNVSGFFATHPHDGEGYVYLVLLLTAPWSMAFLTFADPILNWIEPDVLNEWRLDVVNVGSVFVGAGMNALLIAGVGRYLRWIRRSPPFAITTTLTGVLATFTVLMLVYPRIEALAAEMRRPSSVRPDAVPWGSWAWHWCEFVPATDTNRCIIWDRDGVVRYDEEFVLSGGGGPVRPGELVIAQRHGGEHRIGLKNGRVLWPRSVWEGFGTEVR